jgi:hypothetical protein
VTAFDRVYVWKNNARRADFYGRRCRIVDRGSTLHSVLVEFEDGSRLVTSTRALRKAGKSYGETRTLPRGDNE